MLLASQIGIYGSVIGVGVGSVVSAVASQLYKKFFTASAEKLRELKPGETGYVPPAKGASDDAEAEAPDPSGRTAARHAAGPAGATATLPQAEKTARLSPQDPAGPYETARRSRTPRADDTGLRDDPTVQRARERREHKKKLQRRVVAVSIASAIVAVALSALVIDLVTTGQGVGAKPQPLISSSSQAQKQDSSGSGDASDEKADKGTSSGSSDPSATDPSKDAAPNGSSGSSGGNSSSGGDQGSSDGLGIFGIIGIGLVGFVGRLLGFVGLVGRLRQRHHGGRQRIGRQRAVRQRLARFRLAAEFGRLALQFDPKLGDPKLGRRHGCRDPMSGGNEGALRERSRRGRPCPGSPAA